MRTLLYCLAFPVAAALALGVVALVNFLEKRRDRLRPDQVPHNAGRWPTSSTDPVAEDRWRERLRSGGTAEEGSRWLN